MKKSATFALACLMLILPFQLLAQKAVNYQALDNYIQEAIDDFELPGLAVAIVKDSNVVFSKAYGFRNFEKKEPLTTKSLFNIASCSKAFTAATLGLLVDEGTLTWKDKVIDYYTDFRMSDPYITKELNMIDILSHRSGLGTFDGDLLWYETDYTDAEILRRMRYFPMRNDFRTEFGYQNNMYLLAGEVVKAASGKTWAEFVYEKIFAPLEMTESRTCSGDLKERQDIAMPHLKRVVNAYAMPRPNPAGSIFSSVDEMSHWIQMLLNGGKWNGVQVLSERTISALFSPRTILPVSKSMLENGTHFRAYCLGWIAYDYFGKKVLEHGGGMPGYISKVALVPEEKLGMVILTNDMNGLPDALRNKILDVFLSDRDKDWAALYFEMTQKSETRREERELEREEKRVKKTRPSLKLEEYAGLYRDEKYGDAMVEFENKKLHLTLLPTKKVFTSQMEHWHFDTFRIKFKDEFLPEGFITFNFNTDREVTGFLIDLPNPDFHFKNLKFEKVPEK